MTPWAWPISTQGARLTGFKLGTTRNCYILNIKEVCLMLSEEDFISFPIISLCEQLIPGVLPVWTQGP